MVMAHGLNSTAMKRGPTKASTGDQPTSPSSPTSTRQTGIGSRRIFPPHFKLQVLDSYRQDADCKGNQRATARKYGIHRRQIQKWLQAEANLRSSVKKSEGNNCATAVGASSTANNSVCVVVACSPRDVLALETPPLPHSRQQDDVKPARLTPTTPPPLDCSMQPADIAPPPILPMDLSVKRAPTTTTTTSLGRGEARSRSRSPITAAPAKPLFKPYLLKDEDDRSTTTTNNNNNTILHNRNEDVYLQYAYPYESLDVGYVFDESGAFQPATWLPFGGNPLQPTGFVSSQQRNSYSLEFKLRTIDSYYRDECCKGNQRAVANKYNIHRRQVQKWLKQESELRERTTS